MPFQFLKLINPLSYPLAMLAGGILLFVGVRIISLPSVLVVPVATGLTLGTAYIRKQQEPNPEKKQQRQVEAELQGVRTAAIQLQAQAQTLREQANQLLHREDVDAMFMEVLAAVQYGCNLAIALPEKVDSLADKLPQTRSLLNATALQQQLKTVRAEQKTASQRSLDSLKRLERSIQRNLQLLATSQDDRQSQINNLAILIQDAAGVLQRLQNYLGNTNLANVQQLDQLQDLVGEMNQLQQQMDWFI